LGCFGLAAAYAGALATANTEELWRRQRGHFLWDSGLMEFGSVPVFLLTSLGLLWAIAALRRKLNYRWPAILALVLNGVPTTYFWVPLVWFLIRQKLRSMGG